MLVKSLELNVEGGQCHMDMVTLYPDFSISPTRTTELQLSVYFVSSYVHRFPTSDSLYGGK